MSESQQAKLMRRATYASVSVAFTLIVIKLVAFIMTGSVALLTSLVDSALDSLASVLNFIAVRHALEPADEEHRFGHGKAEPLAGLGQAAFIMGSSIFLIVEAINRLFNPQELQHTDIGIAVMLISLAVTICLVLYQRYVVRKTGSLAIQADSIHYFSDIAVNVGVIIALLLTSTFGWGLADPLFALTIAIYIIYSAWKIVKQSLDQLMDRELSDEEREQIEKILQAHPGIANHHDLRTRASGKDIFIQAHVEMDATLSLLKAHEIVEAAEEKLQQVFPTADIIIHQDPVHNLNGVRS